MENMRKYDEEKKNVPKSILQKKLDIISAISMALLEFEKITGNINIFNLNWFTLLLSFLLCLPKKRTAVREEKRHEN